MRIELRQSINRLREGIRSRRRKFVPLRKGLRPAEPECAAQIHDAQFGICREQFGHKFERSLVRCRKKDDIRAALATLPAHV